MINYLLIGFNQSFQAISVFLGGIVLILFSAISLIPDHQPLSIIKLPDTMASLFLIVSSMVELEKQDWFRMSFALM